MSEDKEIKKKKHSIILSSSSPAQEMQDSFNDVLLKREVEKDGDIMSKLIRQATGTANKKTKIPRLAFAEDPNQRDNYAGIFKLKKSLLPPYVIKQIRVQNLLVAAILRARGNTLSMFGHLQKDRFNVGIKMDIKEEFKKEIKPEEMVKIQERIAKTEKIIINCGYTDGINEKEKTTLSEFFDVQSRNGLSFGWFATEIIYKDEDEKDFHRFRPVDAGTIYHSVKDNDNVAESIRRSSIKALEQMTGVKIDRKVLEQFGYDWIQVVQGIPRQAFTSDELLIYNMYPSSDVEHMGYPVTPLDTVITSVTTHSSIEVYNKLYFQNGRAAKGMLVIQSDEIDQAVIEDVKQQFNASINNVTNSFRTPIFGVSKDDSVQWVQTTPNKKDGEFEYLFDQTTRNILSAFNMSPDELPGFTHLSRGTNQSSLSESSNEYKLIAARDTGIRPLINHWENFLNNKLLPLIDPELAQLCDIVLTGLDAETREKESQRLAADMPLHMTYDEVMEETEKEVVGTSMGGSVPFNEAYRSILDAYKDVSDITSYFMESAGASFDPILRYKRDQFYFQHMEILSQANPEAYRAAFTTRPDAIEIIKMLVKDFLEECEEE